MANTFLLPAHGFTVEDFYKSAQEFLVHMDKQMQLNNLALPPHWSIDHICYRTSTTADYLKFKSHFKKIGTELCETEVNGRPISVLKLSKPIPHSQNKIDLVELPAPKPNKITKEGFEHIEVVCDLTFTDLQQKYSHLSKNFNLSATNKYFNPEFEIEIDSCAIKFHHLSLESVVRLEQNTKVMSAIVNSKILEILHTMQPLIAGTYPIGVNVIDSDIDVLVKSTDLNALSKKLFDHFGNAKNYSQHHTQKQNLPSLITQFTWDDVPFEIFAQNKNSVEQQAYLHFQIEERLLRIGGPNLCAQILNLRSQGFKTEPAFGKALKITDDPYETLLKWHTLSESQLINLLEPVLNFKIN